METNPDRMAARADAALDPMAMYGGGAAVPGGARWLGGGDVGAPGGGRAADLSASVSMSMGQSLFMAHPMG